MSQLRLTEQLRILYIQTKITKKYICSFVFSKSRLSTLKEQCSIAIPKLELQAAVITV